jgi:dTDP-4-dehydrorhamnose reductase
MVTGGQGLLGSRVCRRLKAAGEEVFAPSREVLDLADGQKVLAFVEETRPDVILNPASMTEVDLCEREPERAFRDNVRAPVNLAKAAGKVGAHLVHLSTDYVFDGEAGPYSEDDLPNPRGVYALTKHMGEQAVRAMGGSFAVARTAVVYGWPAARRPNFGAWLVGALRSGQEVRLFEDQFVSPSLADHVAEMVIELGQRKLTGVWNTAGAETVNRLQFAQALCEVFRFSQKLLIATRLKDARLASPRPLHSGLKPDKAAAELQAKPLRLAEALDRFHWEFKESTV